MSTNNNKQPTVALKGVQDIPWICYVKPTQSDAAQAQFKIVTEVGLWIEDCHAHAIENAGYEIKALAQSSQYGFVAYVDDSRSVSSTEPSSKEDGEVDPR